MTPLTVIRVERQTDGRMVTLLFRPEASFTAAHFGLAICDIVRHVAKMFRIDEQKVWEWVEKERARPTTTLTEVKPS